MPELSFRLRWPDDSETVSYSPSTIVRDYFTAGAAYDVGDFLQRARLALRAASARVEEKYGHPCARAAASLSAIERQAGAFAAQPGALVTVVEVSP
jgi:uncharacterized repeat protein (TIGR04042 family)